MLVVGVKSEGWGSVLEGSFHLKMFLLPRGNIVHVNFTKVMQFWIMWNLSDIVPGRALLLYNDSQIANWALAEF